MLWEVEITALGHDRERQRAGQALALFTHGAADASAFVDTSRGYLLESDPLTADAQAQLLALLHDPVVETGTLRALVDANALRTPETLTVTLKPGVMDPTAGSILEAARALGVPLAAARTFRRYRLDASALTAHRDPLLRRVLANDAIEQAMAGPLPITSLRLDRPYRLDPQTVALADCDDAALLDVSRRGQLALTLDEMRTVQAHFREQGRAPTDIELETIAQTWSEHCSHKTLKGRITLDGRKYGNLLKETIFAATAELRRRWGTGDWCVSVFADNAGVVKFTNSHHVCIKVETHNRPSAIEPYGGANTGLGGVIRDALGTGLGSKPVANTDVFCFAPLDIEPEALPPGVLHPRTIAAGVVAGVRDYGNRIGIPTVNGAVQFDARYLANPLVFCGTVGLMPVGNETKDVLPGDLIVAIGGRTGRDGIHGATFSSLELHAESETVSGGAVQIGHAIEEKKVLDALMQASGQGLYRAITDCGAGGFSSAIGEMAEGLGATVHLDRAPLKYQGLSYTDIWISESQERMVLAVPPDNWDRLEALCNAEGVTAAVLGQFEDSGRLKLLYDGQTVGDCDLKFLHDGRPTLERTATLPTRIATQPSTLPTPEPTAALLALLARPNVASKEAIIRQYDHEVQGGSVLKPLVGVRGDGPGDAAVIAPVLGENRGLVLGCGLCPQYSDYDCYLMAMLAIDEAVRNVVAVGADPARIALLDNFCWGNVHEPDVLGGLVRAVEACRDASLVLEMPFVSGKDSLNNEYRSPGRQIRIPGTLLITALGQVPDITQVVSMDFKAPGNAIYLVGQSASALAGSEYHRMRGASDGELPTVDLIMAGRLFKAVHAAITAGLVRACHDLSDGGLAVAVAEMAFTGEVGADITASSNELTEAAWLFGESPTRFLLEVPPTHEPALLTLFERLPLHKIGRTVKEQRLRIADAQGEWRVWASLKDLKAAWQSVKIV